MGKWWDIVKLVRTNEYTAEQHMEGKAFVVKDSIWIEAGGRPWGDDDAEGWKYMDIEDIEESIGRRLTYNDFRIHYRNGLAPNPVLIDRLGGPAKQDKILREAYWDLIDMGMSGQSPPIQPFLEFLSRKPNHLLTDTIKNVLIGGFKVPPNQIQNEVREWEALNPRED